MYNITPAIVVVAYNRPRSLARLLSSLSRAWYPDGNISLVISIDKGDNNSEVLEIATNFKWGFGEKKVVAQIENLGLRKHVLQCGDLTLEYGAIIMLEDDLYVSPNFYDYSVQALDFVSSNKSVGGISLYNHQLNVHNRRNFQPLDDGFDNWYFQFASSWGQAWTKEQWVGFKAWYMTKPNIDSAQNIPKNVRNWSEKSWLKYFIAYLIFHDKYFLYPKVALTTNFSDAGTHVGEDSTVFQLPLLFSRQKTYRFSVLSNSNAIYDAFYENMLLAEKIGLKKDELVVDLYGFKDTSIAIKESYFLSSQKLNLKIMRTFGCSLKPREANIIENIDGDDFFLYELNHEKRESKIKDDSYRELVYNFKTISLKESLLIAKIQAREKFKRFLKRFF